MNAFIKKNGRSLKFYSKILQIMGPLMLVCGIAWGVFGATQQISKFGDWEAMEEALHAGPVQAGTSFLLGLILLIVAQLIRYLFNTEYQPGWILRHGDKVLYTHAAFIFVHSLWFCKRYLSGQYSFHTLSQVLEVSNALSYMLIRLSIVLILVGTGQILRRILLAIKELKTPA